MFRFGFCLLIALFVSMPSHAGTETEASKEPIVLKFIPLAQAQDRIKARSAAIPPRFFPLHQQSGKAASRSIRGALPQVTDTVPTPLKVEKPSGKSKNSPMTQEQAQQIISLFSAAD